MLQASLSRFYRVNVGRYILMAVMAVLCYVPLGKGDSSSSEEHRPFPPLGPIFPVLPSRPPVRLVSVPVAKTDRVSQIRDCVCTPDAQIYKDFYPDRDVEITGNIPDVHTVPAVSYPSIVEFYPERHQRRPSKLYTVKQVQHSDDSDKVYLPQHPQKRIGIELNAEIHQHSTFSGPEKKPDNKKQQKKEEADPQKEESREKLPAEMSKKSKEKEPVSVDINIIPIGHSKDNVYHPHIKKYPVHVPNIRSYHPSQPGYHEYKPQFAY